MFPLESSVTIVPKEFVPSFFILKSLDDKNDVLPHHPMNHRTIAHP